MVQERVRHVIGSVFELAPADLPELLGPQTLPGWTSLRHLRIVIELQKEFGIEIDPDVVPELLSEQDMTSYVTDRLRERAGQPAI